MTEIVQGGRLFVQESSGADDGDEEGDDEDDGDEEADEGEADEGDSSDMDVESATKRGRNLSTT